MSNGDEKIGYLLAKVEELSNDQKNVMERLSALEVQIESTFKTVKLVVKVVGWMGSGVLALITVPWDKVVDVFKKLGS